MQELNYHWIIKVILSCKNYTQLMNAEKLIYLFWQKYKNNDIITADCNGLERCFYWKCNELKH